MDTEKFRKVVCRLFSNKTFIAGIFMLVVGVAFAFYLGTEKSGHPAVKPSKAEPSSSKALMTDAAFTYENKISTAEKDTRPQQSPAPDGEKVPPDITGPQEADSQNGSADAAEKELRNVSLKSKKVVTVPAQAKSHQNRLVSLGEYKITFYCSCVKCCGKSDGITATGTIATAGKTIAVDPKVISLGSKVIIDGNEYIAEDTGGFKGQTIDMYVDSHQDALSRGVIRREVFVVSQ